MMMNSLEQGLYRETDSCTFGRKFICLSRDSKTKSVVFWQDLVTELHSKWLVLIKLHKKYTTFFGHNSPPVGHGLLIHEVSRSHTTTHHSR